MFGFLALALGFLVIGQTVSVLRQGRGHQLPRFQRMVIVIVRELGLLLTAIVMLARVGTATVIELGTARAQGEVEAPSMALGMDPVHYLIVPRVIGMSLGVFALTVYLIIGTLVSVATSGHAFLQNVPLTPGDYFSQLMNSLSWLDFALLALKSPAFGFFIGIVTCYHGLAQPLRIEEVSRVTVRAVTQGLIVCVMIDAVFIMLYGSSHWTERLPRPHHPDVRCGYRHHARSGPPQVQRRGTGPSPLVNSGLWAAREQSGKTDFSSSPPA